MIKGFAYYIGGLVLAMGAVGGVEQSTTTVQLVQSCMLALAAIGLMAVGVSYVKEHENA